MGKIFCFMGKSSSGKDTIFKIVSTDLASIKPIVLYTTRPIREHEIEGVTYHYVSDSVYNDMLQNNLVIESRSYQTIYGTWIYFTAVTNIDLENNSYMMINTLAGYEALKNYYGEDKVIPIYIQVEDGIRLERALTRERKEPEPKYEEMCRRFLADQVDFNEENLIKAKIKEHFYNNNLAECILAIEKKMVETLEKDTKQRQYQK